ncbi:MAG: TlpA disulfide reductase family protein, partial [Marinoscillum sp.]
NIARDSGSGGSGECAGTDQASQKGSAGCGHRSLLCSLGSPLAYAQSPCRAENPNVVRVYNQYGGEDFEILGVSLDRNRDAWVKAIEQDGLPWLHVSDLQYFNSEAATTYQISSIPATYLIGPDGKIIAKGLRGPSLEAKLKEIFG